MSVEYRSGDAALSVDAFIALARRIWQREYDTAKTADALKSTINIGAWSGDRLVGSVRVLSDGYFFSTVPEVMVDPEFRKHGIGRELLRRALEASPGRRAVPRRAAGERAVLRAVGVQARSHRIRRPAPLTGPAWT